MEVELKRSRLEGVMSLNYDACSIIAAETSREAHAWASSKDRKSTRELYVLDESSGTSAGRWRTKLLKSVELPIDYTDGKINLVLATNDDNPANDPKLLVYLRDDLALPIATFARRNGGTCSYVQLGQEMTNENFVVTPYDGRKDIVDSLRSLLRDEVTDLNNIETLIKTEVERNRGIVESQLVPAFYRRTVNLWQSSKKQVTPLWMLGEEGSYLETFKAAPLPESKAILTDGREIDLLLAARQAKNRSPQLELLAVTRGNVALSLTRFSNGEVINPQTNQPYHSAEIEQLRKIVTQPPSEKARELAKAQQDYSSKELIRAIHRAVLLSPRRSSKAIGATKAAIELFAPELTRHLPKNYNADSYIKVLNNPYEAEGYYSSDPLRDYWSTNDYGQKKNKKLFKQVSRLREAHVQANYYREWLRKHSPNQQALAALGTENLFANVLGEYSKRSEKLIAKLGSLAAGGNRFAGQINQYQVNQDRGDILIFADVSAPDTRRFSLRIEGRPAALDGFDNSPIYPALEISTTEKIDLEPDEIEEILQLLGHLGSTAIQP